MTARTLTFETYNLPRADYIIEDAEDTVKDYVAKIQLSKVILLNLISMVVVQCLTLLVPFIQNLNIVKILLVLPLEYDCYSIQLKYYFWETAPNLFGKLIFGA